MQAGVKSPSPSLVGHEPLRRVGFHVPYMMGLQSDETVRSLTSSKQERPRACSDHASTVFFLDIEIQDRA